MKAGAIRIPAWLLLVALLAGRAPVAHGAEPPSGKATNAFGSSTDSPAMRSARGKYEQGMKYLDGEGVKEDVTQGVRLIRDAAEAGLPEAQCKLGDMLTYGVGAEMNKAEAVDWYRKAAEQGDPEGEVGLSRCYYNGYGVMTNDTEAAKWCRKAAEKGNRTAQRSLGVHYELGAGVPQDYAEAVKWYRRAAEQGHAGAAADLSDCYSGGRGVSTNRIEAYKWLTIADGCDISPLDEDLKRLAAQMTASDVAEAQRLAALLVIPEKAKREIAETQYAFGTACFASEEFAQAARLFRKAAELGHSQAQLRLWWMYYRGKGVAKDAAEAVKWCRKAAEQGSAVAQFNLGMVYSEGEGVSKDALEAAKWYRMAAEQGHGSAQLRLIVAYANGDGVAKDAAEASKWLRKAAEQGDFGVQHNLGVMYSSGEGVPKDAVEALKWYRKAADQGFAVSQWRLGVAYANGEGVPKDDVEAAMWYRKAAEQDLAFAQQDLGAMYANGEGVRKDDVQAYKWFNLAAAKGVEEAKESRSVVERRMVPSQVAEAQRLSRDFRPRSAGTAPDRESSPAEAVEVARPTGTGSGFFVSADGYLLTSQHVVESASRIVVQCAAGKLPAKVVTTDAANDLALLKVAGTFKPLPLAASRAVKLGDSVFTVGFPNVEMQGQRPKLTKGEISSLAGAQDDPRHFQISVAVQPGNSGGPLVTEAGAVVGVIEAKLSARAAFKTTGALPENVNYALKSSYAMLLLESVPDVASKLRQAPTGKSRPWSEVVKEVEDAVALVLAY